MNTSLALTHLSLARVGNRRTPQVPTNEDRVKAYRAFAPVQFGNTLFARSPAERYALAESIDNSTPTTDVHYRETL